MPQIHYEYVIIGGGLAGVSAIEGIREIDKEGEILLAGNEKNMPYDRPPLTKKLWTGAKKISEIFLHGNDFYKEMGAELAMGSLALELLPDDKTVIFNDGRRIRYSKLLLATGGSPRRLDIPGGNLEEICYFRTLNDYQNIRSIAEEGRKALIIGGGFIGSEMAAALNINKVEVTMLFPGDYLVSHVFTEELGTSIQEHYMKRGIEIIRGDLPVSIERKEGFYLTKTKNGSEIKSDFIIAGIGILPNTGLAEKAGLLVNNGITVNEYLQTSDTDIYSAGDNTNFILKALEKRTRVEHWDNSIWQGKTAGKNMAGGKTPFEHIPYFFSDLFEFGYEAAGELNPKLETVSLWKKEFETGIIYYMNNGNVMGIMLCNVWDKIEAAREIINKKEKFSRESIKNAIVF